MNTLLTGVVGRLVRRGGTARAVTDGRPLIFDASAGTNHVKIRMAIR
ncbi:hypothetical protein [Streptomyces carpinensis]|uniref:Uncharacterized protein n=1 Tax=Streptomyces carpinensis TaxID=66369 RepID=A0ABV1W530_9ACTN|nr:hypothetical protein [Streptomyces carpinensis]